jgi:hypothetical protein
MRSVYLLGLLWLLPLPAMAQQPAQEEQAPSRQQQAEDEKQQQAYERWRSRRTLGPPDGRDEPLNAENAAWLDNVQRGMASTVDATARWVDRFFADSRTFEETAEGGPRAQSVGRLSIGPEWDQADGWDVDSSLRLRFYLPNTENRISAIVGRLDFDEFIAGEDTTRPALIRSPDSDKEWLIGLGYDPVIRDQRRVSFGAGFRGGLDLDPYLRARFLVQGGLSDRSQLRSQSVAFWRDSDGFGVSQRLDYEIGIGERWLGRWSGRITYAQRTDGIRWETSGTAYYLRNDDQALAAELWTRGETERDVTVNDYGLRGIYRQRYAREWFFVEPWIGMHWPREELTDVRDGAWIVGVQFEILFGQQITRMVNNTLSPAPTDDASVSGSGGR